MSKANRLAVFHVIPCEFPNGPNPAYKVDFSLLREVRMIQYPLSQISMGAGMHEIYSIRILSRCGLESLTDSNHRIYTLQGGIEIFRIGEFSKSPGSQVVFCAITMRLVC
jgi:hypothetical protein